jgi:class 3 adenylate cyclase
MSSTLDVLLEQTEKNIGNPELRKKQLQNSAVYGTIIVIDLVGSTDLKYKNPFPSWVPIIEHFYEVVTKAFSERRIEPIKFLGDAVLYFIPDLNDNKTKKYAEMRFNDLAPFQDLSFTEVLELCEKSKRDWWDTYCCFLECPESKPNFQAITIAIDYGHVIDFNLEKEGGIPDPIGEPVDRCFRISKQAGINHILFSEEFFKKIDNEKIDLEKILEIQISKTLLKGIKNDNRVFYYIPQQDELTAYDKEDDLSDNISKIIPIKIKMALLKKENIKFKAIIEGRSK